LKNKQFRTALLLAERGADLHAFVSGTRGQTILDYVHDLEEQPEFDCPGLAQRLVDARQNYVRDLCTGKIPLDIRRVPLNLKNKNPKTVQLNRRP
jgi:hypothetical protein